MALVGEQLISYHLASFTTVNHRDTLTLDPAGPQPFRAVVDPITGYRLSLLPEGDRDTRNLYILSDDIELPTKDQVNQAGATAFIIFEGDYYEVKDKMVYREICPHVEYRVKRAALPLP